ncbi:MAG: DUF1189 family protein, partial [Candidatus Omnitrophota bacterium]
PEFYGKIARQSIGRTIGFLFILILVISAVFSLQAALAILPQLKHVQRWADVNLKKISGEFPAIEIKDGELIQPKETYVLEIGKNLAFAVEPDPQKESAVLEKYGNLFMLTSKQFVFKQTGENSVTEERRRDLDKVKSWKMFPVQSGLGMSFENNQVLFTSATVQKWLKAVKIFIFPVFLLFLSGLYSFTKFTQVLFFSLFGMIANAVLKVKAEYKQIFNVCVYALVPPVILSMALDVLHVRLPGFWFLFSAIYILYIFLGMRSAKGAVNQVKAE